MPNFHSEPITSWSDFLRSIADKQSGWLFRGQREDWTLKSSLERALDDWEVDIQEASPIEEQMVRHFRRHYTGSDMDRTVNDTLYALALMQHHGAPTRLLDFTYSPFVAANFAVQSTKKMSVIWCINAAWCHREASKVAGADALDARNTDTTRDDSSFLPMYGIGGPRMRLVYPENPLYLNPRLAIQQGLFLCPGDVGARFEENLMALSGFDLPENVSKLILRMPKHATYEFASMLRRMNLDSAALFPGIDGFARSLGEWLFLHQLLASSKTGRPDYVRPT